MTPAEFEEVAGRVRPEWPRREKNRLLGVVIEIPPVCPSADSVMIGHSFLGEQGNAASRGGNHGEW